jgi:hypothetical protein
MTAPVLKPVDPAIDPLDGAFGGVYGRSVFGSDGFGGPELGAGFSDLYYRILMGTLPPGAYTDDDVAPHAVVRKAAAAGLGSGLELIYQLADEVFPQYATECLGDWEGLYGIGSALLEGSLDARRANLLAAVRGGKPCTVAAFTEQMAGALGEGTFTIYENLTSYNPAEPDDVFFVFVWRDPTQPGTYDTKTAQRIADRFKESHVLITVGESKAFKTNDPYSRTNRDILGA